MLSPAEFVGAEMAKPDLLVDYGNLPGTAEALRDLFAASRHLFERAVPVRVVPCAHGAPTVIPLTRASVVVEAHRVCRPVRLIKGVLEPTTLPDRVAAMFLDMAGEWDLRPLDGVTTAPLLRDDGSIRSAAGYDSATRLWCFATLNLKVLDRPRRSDALRALAVLRDAFRTFPFADSARCFDPEIGLEVVDTDRPPGLDESTFLGALLTAVCRASLPLAPGLLVTAPEISGAGCGKGLLVRAICMIAFGTPARAFTKGADRQELDKRLAAELIEAHPFLFMDNVNSTALRSDCLASVMTENPSRVRLLGQTRMVPLNASVFVAVTGNGLSVSEDLARRFLTCELDARCEDPESRHFAPGFLEKIKRRRTELLTAALVIWRWGRDHKLAGAKPLGGFEVWGEWCRDPLVALGCADPVERIAAVKAADPKRQRITEFFLTWWQHHGSRPMAVSDLDSTVTDIVDPQGRGRQYLAAFVGRLDGTRAGGFVLTRQASVGYWTAATYALRPVDGKRVSPDRNHRVHREGTGAVRPMHPMPDSGDDLSSHERSD